MSSTLFKAAFAGAITAAALLLPAGAAQAATRHYPCNEPGFGDSFYGDDLDFFDGGFGFPLSQHWYMDDRPVIIVVSTTHHHHDKPAPADNGSGGGSNDGYHKGAGAA